MSDSLDTADRLILDALQRNARTGLEVLAEQTGLSPASVQRRIKRLKDRKVILGEVAIVDPAKVGQGMTFIVMLEFQREHLTELDLYARRLLADPQVQQVYHVTGAEDFCMICTARDMADFEDLTKRLFYEDSIVSKYRTMVTIRRIKVGLDVYVPTAT